MIADLQPGEVVVAEKIDRISRLPLPEAVAMITRMSPAAWRHILLNGHYTFQSGGKMIDLDALLAGLDLE